MDLLELSIEETNKLRAQIGLPLIPIPESKPDVAAHKPPTIEMKVRSIGLPRSAPEAVQSTKKTTAPSSKLSFAYDDVDTDSWLDNVGKTTTHVAAPSATIDEPTELTKAPRLQVKHSHQDLLDVKDGEIFTLEDNSVMDDKEEALINERLAKASKLRSDLSEKRKLDYQELGRTWVQDDAEIEEQPTPLSVEGSTIILNTTTPVDVPLPETGTLFTDLFAETKKAPIRMKKISKKKPSSRKRAREESLPVPEVMQTEVLSLDEPDADLDSILNSTLRKKSRQAPALTAEQIADQVRMHQRVDMANDFDGGLIFDETSDFLSVVGTRKDEPESASKKNTASPQLTVEIQKPAAEVSATPLAQSQELEPLTQAEKEDTGSDNVERGTELNDDEPNTNTGFSSLSSTLMYLRGQLRNLPQATTHTKADRQRQKDAELTRIKIGIEERIVREELSKDPKFNLATAEEQESIVDRVLGDRLLEKGLQEGPQRRGKYSRYASAQGDMDTYNPQVKVTYKDSYGRAMDKKQAWKELLHQYHDTRPKHKKEAGKPRH